MKVGIKNSLPEPTNSAKANRLTVTLPSGVLSIQADATSIFSPDSLCGYASRQNAKRAFLFVSRVLGKHIPASAGIMRITHVGLANLLRPFLAKARKVVFLGFAETATGLGAGVFEAAWRRNLNLQDSMLFMQTTRYRLDKPVALDFQEEHSHATSHILYEPTEGALFHSAESLVLVDDELTTGQTNLNFLSAFLKVNPNVQRVALVSLVSWLTSDRRLAFTKAFPSIVFSFFSLASGTMTYTANPDFECPLMPAVRGNDQLKDYLLDSSGSARFGWTKPMAIKAKKVLALLSIDASRPVRVVGDGEFMHAAYLVAQALSDTGLAATAQTTTRSPILLGNAIESIVQFEDHYGDSMVNFLYNPPGYGDQVVFVHEAKGPLSLLAHLPGCTVQTLHIQDFL